MSTHWYSTAKNEAGTPQTVRERPHTQNAKTMKLSNIVVSSHFPATLSPRSHHCGRGRAVLLVTADLEIQVFVVLSERILMESNFENVFFKWSNSGFQNRGHREMKCQELFAHGPPKVVILKWPGPI